jgi:hypothetical protein
MENDPLGDRMSTRRNSELDKLDVQTLDYTYPIYPLHS